MPITHRQTLFFVYKQNCIHTYLSHTFKPRNTHIFKVFPQFSDLLISSIPDVQNFYTAGDVEI